VFQKNNLCSEYAKGRSKKGCRPQGRREKQSEIEREILAAQQIDAARRGQRQLAVDEMEKALRIAEEFANANQPEPIKDADGRVVRLNGGDVKLFGQWFDRWTFLLKEVAK